MIAFATVCGKFKQLTHLLPYLVPRIAILLTEGYTNEGMSPIFAANDIRRIPGGKVFAIGMGGGVIQRELLLVAGNSQNRLFLLEFTSDIAVLGELIKETGKPIAMGQVFIMLILSIPRNTLLVYTIGILKR